MTDDLARRRLSHPVPPIAPTTAAGTRSFLVPLALYRHLVGQGLQSFDNTTCASGWAERYTVVHLLMVLRSPKAVGPWEVFPE